MKQSFFDFFVFLFLPSFHHAEEEDKKPSLEKLVEEREARKRTRSKFHGRALEWSRQGADGALAG